MSDMLPGSSLPVPDQAYVGPLTVDPRKLDPWRENPSILNNRASEDQAAVVQMYDDPRSDRLYLPSLWVLEGPACGRTPTGAGSSRSAGCSASTVARSPEHLLGGQEAATIGAGGERRAADPTRACLLSARPPDTVVTQARHYVRQPIGTAER